MSQPPITPDPLDTSVLVETSVSADAVPVIDGSIPLSSEVEAESPEGAVLEVETIGVTAPDLAPSVEGGIESSVTGASNRFLTEWTDSMVNQTYKHLPEIVTAGALSLGVLSAFSRIYGESTLMPVILTTLSVAQFGLANYYRRRRDQESDNT